MRPIGPDQSGFLHDGLGRSFSFEPTEGPLSDWQVSGSYELVDGKATITELRISPRRPSTPEKGITGTLLRQIKPAALTDLIRSKEEGWLSFLEKVRGVDDDETLDPAYLRMRDNQIEQAESVVAAPRSGPAQVRGRPPLSDDFLEGVAQEHVEEIEFDTRYGAIRRLAESRDVPYNTAKHWIAKARARGLYPTTDGKE